MQHDRASPPLLKQLRFIAPALIFAGLVQAAVLWRMGWDESRLLLTSGTWVAVVASGVILARGCSFYVFHHPTVERRLTHKLAIIGYDAHASFIAKHFVVNAQYGIGVVGFFADDPSPQGQVLLTGSIADLITLTKQSRVDSIIIALPSGRGHEAEIANLVWRLRSVPADLLVVPYLALWPDVLLPTQPIGPMTFTVLQRQPLRAWEMLCKQCFDDVICLIILIPLSLVFLATSIAIKLDSPGPILFRQPRRGFNNRLFTVFKFRTMYANQTDILATRQTSRDDPRVTRVGKWLRWLSIDELPQIFNVLRGEMSLVGPRPHAPETRIEGELLDNVIVNYVMRYKVKPGITGWAQVNGARGQLVKSEDLRKRVTYDLEYIQRWSIAFDLKIMVLTVLRELFSKHAF
jgi:Undecaprenyl-phosphate glucose phosphotransferase